MITPGATWFIHAFIILSTSVEWASILDAVHHVVEGVVFVEIVERFEVHPEVRDFVLLHLQR